jgi:hypothetical protein
MKDNKLLISRVKMLMGDMSNRKFAAKCGLTDSPIRNLLKGGEWDSKTLKSIAESFQKPLWWFFSDDADESKVRFTNCSVDAEVDELGEKLSHDAKRDLLEKTAEVLDSDTIYRPALVSNIRAFHYGVREVARMSKIEDDMEEMKASMRRMEQMILSFAGSTPAVGNEKKRVGDDL